MFNGAKKVAFCKVVIGLMICAVGSSEILAMEKLSREEKATLMKNCQKQIDEEEAVRDNYKHQMEQEQIVQNYEMSGKEPQDQRLVKRKVQFNIPGGVPPQQSNDSNKKKKRCKE